MKVEQPTTEQVRELPCLMQHSVPPEWEDQNGHVNVKYYMTLYDLGGWPMISAMGIDEAYFLERRCGFFDLEHHILYLSELHVGDRINIYLRLVNKSQKRFHGIMFIVNDRRDLLASTLEFVTSGADLDERRTAAFPDDVAARLDRMIEEHGRPSWFTPLCGVMSA